MIGFVYLWYDRKRKMFYVGSHLGIESDNYVCSNERMTLAYRKRREDFKRRIIERIHDGSILAIRVAEQRWLDMIKPEELGVRYYNLNRRASGFDREFGLKRAEALHAERDENGKSIAGVRFNQKAHSIKDERGKSIAGVRGGIKSIRILHSKKDENGKSINSIKGGKAAIKILHSEKDKNGKSLHAIKMANGANLEKDENGKSITAVKGGIASTSLQDDNGKSVHASAMSKIAHSEKDETGKSLHAIKMANAANKIMALKRRSKGLLEGLI